MPRCTGCENVGVVESDLTHALAGRKVSSSRSVDPTSSHVNGVGGSTSQNCHQPLTTSVADRIENSIDQFSNRLNAVARKRGFVLSKVQRSEFDFRGCQVT